MKRVCIAGAGPAGLVTAKVFLSSGQFEVTVYEKKNRIGGIWAVDQTTRDGFISPFTPTNLSRFLVSFSDLDWHSVDLSADGRDPVRANGDSETADRPPMFPFAWQVNRYLEHYRQEHIPDGVITLNREIIHAERTKSGWQVTTQDMLGAAKVEEFDYFVMANGFFPEPRPLGQDVRNSIEPSSVKIIHSSAFRGLSDLFPPNRVAAGKKILVIGGGNSSGETAASVAMQLSNTQWSPDQSELSIYKGCSIVHVTPQPIYPLPPFQEFEDGSLSYVPLDFKFYNLATRPDLASYAGLQPPEVSDTVHKIMRAVVGGDQSDLSESLVSHKGSARFTPQASLTETYAEFVRSGLIEVVLGRVSQVSNDDSGNATTLVQTTSGEISLDGVAAIIYATGYNPGSAINILDEKTRNDLQYDRSAMRLPLILEQWQTCSRNVPTLSFVGFYQGPYWGIIELQAHLTARRWLYNEMAPTKAYETNEALLDLRNAMNAKARNVPQYGFGDYLGWMLDLASQVGATPNDGNFGAHEGSTVPARYHLEGNTRPNANSTMTDLHSIWKDCIDNGHYVARAVFRALQGDWRISRKIDSALQTTPSGTFEGSAHFHQRTPTPDKSGQVFDFEFLYIETGMFFTTSGGAINASRHYVYRYSEARDQLSVWFVKPDRVLEADYLFHDLAFAKPGESREVGACVAKADHLCIKDMYQTEYRFPMKGVSLREFTTTHAVKGPAKDYIAVARYERFKKVANKALD